MVIIIGSVYVTPIFDGNTITGYESVRVLPSEEQKQRAARVYALLAGQKTLLVFDFIRYYTKQLAPVWLPMVAIIISLLLIGWSTAAILLVTAIVTCIATCWHHESAFKQLMALRPDAFTNRIVAYTYSKDGGAKAQLEMMIRSEAARSRTAITRVEDSVAKLGSIVRATREQAAASNALIEEQTSKTQDVASAINQMSTSIQEVADSVENNAEKSETAARNVDTGVAGRTGVASH